MQNAADILLKINTLLDQLIETARALEKLSNKVVSEEEINGLQSQQEEAIEELIRLDEELHKEFPEVATQTEEREAIHKKMAEFQKINHRFIENLERGSGIIKFE